jgi:hypothetical protein
MSATLGEYRERLDGMLGDAEATLSVAGLRRLRTAVRERRNLRRGSSPSPAPADVAKRADAIVVVLDEAGRVLRPRETQELDDLVAGKRPPEPAPTPRSAARRHQRGSMRPI